MKFEEYVERERREAAQEEKERADAEKRRADVAEAGLEKSNAENAKLRSLLKAHNIALPE